jgi:ribonuclease HII
MAQRTADTTSSRFICGLDEVGRGALAGPLVAAAVILPPHFAQLAGDLLPLVRDSKTLSRRQREIVAELIRQHALHLDLEAVPSCEIDENGIGWANCQAFSRLILRVQADEYVVDGRLRLDLPSSHADRVRCECDADATVAAVSAASIVAKTYRDNLMCHLHCENPAYGWDHNVGYGTRDHVAALQEHGPCEHHRRLFVFTALSHRYGCGHSGDCSEQ